MYNGKDSNDSYRPRRFEDTVRKNHMIKAKEVLLVDENGENLGAVSLQDALRKANDAGLDLVEVGSKTNPPVCRIIDYSKYLYEQRKKQKTGKKTGKPKQMKEFKFTPVIETHDSEHRIRRAKEYLSKGHNVRITMYRKGRQPIEQANETFNEILTNFADYSSIEPEPKREGRKIFVTYKSTVKQPIAKNGTSKETKQNKQDSPKEIKEIKPKGE